MRVKPVKPGLAVLVLLAALAAAAAATASPKHAKVVLRSTSLGRVLVDARGHTLYLFDADGGAKSACSAQCAAVWPPYTTAGAPLAGSGVKQALLKTFKRRNGALQVVYAGHPLYFFSGDAGAGQVNGEGIVHFGGTWFAVSAAGTKIEPKPSSGGTDTTPAPGGGGYGGYGP
jgi:predicted lipoprotein with Yx(FWY)xxD motif